MLRGRVQWRRQEEQTTSIRGPREKRARKELDSLAATASKRRWDVGFDYSRGDLQDAVAIAQLVFSLSRVGVSDGRSEPCREAEAAEAESSKDKTAGGVFYACDAHQWIGLEPTNVGLFVGLGGRKGDKRSRLAAIEGHRKTLQGSGSSSPDSGLSRLSVREIRNSGTHA